MKEDVKCISGYPDYYISNKGIITSFKRPWGGRELSPTLNTGGYRTVILYSLMGTHKRFTIHQLVAIMFLGHKPNGMSVVVDHIDGDKENNHADNLQLITSRANVSKSNRVKSSKYVGVDWYKNRSLWRARIRIEDKHVLLGLFEKEHDAHIAYQDKLATLW